MLHRFCFSFFKALLETSVLTTDNNETPPEVSLTQYSSFVLVGYFNKNKRRIFKIVVHVTKEKSKQQIF